MAPNKDEVRLAVRPFGVAATPWTNRRDIPTNGAGGAVVGPVTAQQVEERLPEGMGWDDAPGNAEVEWLIEGVLQLHDDAALFGESGHLKSFMALHMAGCVAAGMPWNGKTVRQGLVVYVAAEGGAGIRMRLRGWRERYGQRDRRIGIVVHRGAVNLMDRREVTALVAKLAALPERPVLVVWDTLNRCMPGADENGSAAYGAALVGLSRIRDATGATNLVLHHPGQGAKSRMRGHYSLHAAIPTELRQQRKGDRVTVTVTKQRDGEDGVGFEFEAVPLKTPDVDTLVLVQHGTRDGAPSVPRGNAATMLDKLATFPRGARHSEWRVATGLSKATFNRLLKDASVSSRIENADGVYQLVSSVPDWSHETH
jgi:hypothetical protein